MHSYLKQSTKIYIKYDIDKIISKQTHNNTHVHNIHITHHDTDK